ncbi:MAG: hypothetical protein IJT12_08615 [Paludibacteraceae bacterium]|nr:hypothetical protein [Paludibacteraceae bacterium]
MKHKLLYIAAIALLAVGCRQKGDVYFDPNDPQNMAYTTYSEQFDVLWRSMNMYYMFWSEDSTDWDQVYYTMKPKFEELDAAYKADESVADSLTFTTLYQEATHSLIDHHLAMIIRDPHTGKPYTFRPGLDEMRSREYTAGQEYTTDAMKAAIADYETQHLLDAGQWGEMNGEENYFGIRTLDDGRKIAYLWQSGFKMMTALEKKDPDDKERLYINNIEAWRDMCLTETQLAGIILDNRCNTGGEVRDLNIVVAPFINEPLYYADVRYKEGPGRYDYTDWIPAYVDTLPADKRRNIEAEGIPYIVLTNAYTISMGEMTAAVIKHLPTGRMIGERTFGAHGRLYSVNTLFYDGTFGDRNGKHYVYTSSMQTRFVQEGMLEGKGITPTRLVYQAEEGYLGAMNKAIDYIKAY